MPDPPGRRVPMRRVTTDCALVGDYGTVGTDFMLALMRAAAVFRHLHGPLRNPPAP